jgi:uncharacterized membrane protein YoaT (DUF817 family)
MIDSFSTEELVCIYVDNPNWFLACIQGIGIYLFFITRHIHRDDCSVLVVVAAVLHAAGAAAIIEIEDFRRGSSISIHTLDSLVKQPHPLVPFFALAPHITSFNLLNR